MFTRKSALVFLDAYCREIDLNAYGNGMAGSPQFLAFVGDFVLRKKPEIVLELGSGLSTAVIASCLKRNGDGRLISLDHDTIYVAQTNDLLNRSGLHENATVYHAPLAPILIGETFWNWYDYFTLTRDLPFIDLVIVDGPPGGVQGQARYPALPLLLDKLSNDAVLIVDDGNRLDEQTMVRRWETEFGVRATFFAHERGTFLLERQGGRTET